MNYTKNYHLPQWEENDRVLRLDFNNAMAALEDGLQANASATDQVKRIAPATSPMLSGAIQAQAGVRPLRWASGLRSSSSPVQNLHLTLMEQPVSHIFLELHPAKN